MIPARTVRWTAEETERRFKEVILFAEPVGDRDPRKVFDQDKDHGYSRVLYGYDRCLAWAGLRKHGEFPANVKDAFWMPLGDLPACRVEVIR
jgi:hypothetical protein